MIPGSDNCICFRFSQLGIVSDVEVLVGDQADYEVGILSFLYELHT